MSQVFQLSQSFNGVAVSLELLTQLRSEGYALAERDGRLIVAPASKLTARQRASIALYRDSILSLLITTKKEREGGYKEAKEDPPLGVLPTPYPATALNTPAEVAELIGQASLLAFDLETTGLDPRRDRVRLLALDDGARSVVLDCFAHDPRPLLDLLKNKILLAHNAAFDLGFLWHLGLTDLPETICTYLLEQLLTAGEGGHGFGSCGLAACCRKYLGRDLAKELQKSDWSGTLTCEQIAYARRDAEVLIPLFRAQEKALRAAGLLRAADVELRALPAFVWMAQAGVPFDRPSWLALADQADRRKRGYAAELDAQAPAKGGPGLFGPVDSWNWDSPQQVAEAFGLAGFDVTTTCDAQLALIPGPLAGLVRQYREQATLLKMYGQNWLDGAPLDGGRVYPSWVQIGAASGRTSCKRPNMQQIPRDPAYRACVRPQSGRVLVKADYATLQMRIAAKWAKDDALIRIFQENGDPHTATAKLLLNTEEPTKADRQIAKSANFGLLFGMTAEGLRVYSKTTWGVDLTLEQATSYRSRWFQGYPGLARWHVDTKRKHCLETRSASGRRRLLPTNAPDTWRLNSPVQADEADGLKSALALLWKRRDLCPGAFPVLAVHDEIVVEADADRAEEAKAWLVGCMTEGMQPWLDPVPVAVDCKVLPSWGD